MGWTTRLKKANNVKMGLFGIIVIALMVVPLTLFFGWLWRVFPFAEKRPLVIWGFVMAFFLLIAVIAGSNDRG